MRRKKEIKLKPCPFCGMPAQQPYNKFEGKTKRPLWIIHCSDYCVSMCRNKKSDVIDDWNKRKE